VFGAGIGSPESTFMDRERLSAHGLSNSLKALLLLATLAGLLGLLAWTLGGGRLALFALGAVVLLYLANLAASPRLVIRSPGLWY